MLRLDVCGSLVAALVLSGCYNEPEIMMETEGTAGTAGDPTAGDDGDGAPTQGSDPTVGDDAPDDDGPVDGSSTTDEPTGDTGTPMPCGNGRMDPGEVCDDGVNDGSYGGCMPDCSAPGPYCGDGEVQDPEEACDNGARNANGSGCNVDCVVSGTVVASWEQGGYSFCDGDFLTEPAFRDDGNVLVAATGYCPADSQVLVEVSPTGDLVQEFDVLLPETPVREGVLVEDDWVLATYGCNYRITPDGTLTEICDDTRTAGDRALDAAADGTYLALDYDLAARYGAGSPVMGDAPQWTVVPADEGIVDIGFMDLAVGPSNSALIVGYRNLTGTPPSNYAYITQYTGAGNEAAENWFSQVPRFDGLVVAPDGSIYVYAEYPSYVIAKLSEGLQYLWDLPVETQGDIRIATDSVGDLVYFHTDANGTPMLRKRDPTGVIERWAVTLPHGGYSTRIATDPSDAIWVASVQWGMTSSVTLDRVAP